MSVASCTQSDVINVYKICFLLQTEEVSFSCRWRGKICELSIMHLCNPKLLWESFLFFACHNDTHTGAFGGRFAALIAKVSKVAYYFFFFIWSPKAARNAFIQNGKCHKMAGIKGKLRELQKASVKVEGCVKNRLKVHNKESGVRIQCKGNLRTMGPGNLMSTAGS